MLEGARPLGDELNGSTRRLPDRFWRTALILTLALGSTVAISWLIFSGTIAFRGPMRVLADRWLLIYGSQSILAALVGFTLAKTAPRTSIRRVGFLILVAWIGEVVVLTLGGSILANELAPTVAWFYWLIGTGGPMQPIAAIVGAVIGRLPTTEASV